MATGQELIPEHLIGLDPQHHLVYMQTKQASTPNFGVIAGWSSQFIRKGNSMADAARAMSEKQGQRIFNSQSRFLKQ